MSGHSPWDPGRDRQHQPHHDPDRHPEHNPSDDMSHGTDDSTHRDATRTEEVDDVHTLVGAYALDALDEGERDSFDAHLAGCDDCRAAVAEFSDTAALLGEAVATPAPASLRASVLQAVARTPQDTPHGRGSGGWGAGTAAPVSLDERRARRQGRPPRWQLALAAACSAVALAATGWGWTASQQAEQARLEAADATAESQRIAELLTAPGSRVQSVTGRQGATATVVRSGSQAVVIGAGLPAVGPGRGYQLWLIDDGDIRPAGMFERDRAGHYTAYVDDTDGVPTLGVTEEPATGSEQPTSEPVLAADISQA
ncbi:anti-sigma factor [Kineococcus sp. NUM-3379]